MLRILTQMNAILLAIVLFCNGFAVDVSRIYAQACKLSQENWGSQDDPKSFAAMRYTESRLTAYANTLLSELEQGTVMYVPNFDGTLREPATLPAQLPNVLLNGASGIAVGMATDIPPHNLTEVTSALIHLLENPKASLEELVNFVQAPDFPTGAEIITPREELLEMYRKGGGAIRLRATYQRIDDEIIIDSLPHQVSGAKIIEQIATQMQAKKLPLVVDIRDEGDHEQPVRVVIVMRSNRVDDEALMSHLFATTDLESSCRVNMNMIGLNGRPAVKDLRTILSEWLTFRIETVKRRLNFRLEQVLHRLHILEGLLVVYLNLDEVIRIIRNSDDPKAKLMAKFKITEIQADAILDTKLRHLAKLEEQKIRAEQDELTKEHAAIEKVLGSDKALRKLIIKEIEQLQQRFGDKRRSKIVARAQAQVLKLTESTPSEPVTIILSEKGWVRAAKGHEIDATKLSFRASDQLLMTVAGKSQQPAVFLDDTGRFYALAVSQLPSARGQGEPLSGKLTLPPGANIVATLMGDGNEQYLLAGSHGYGFLAKLEDLFTKNRTGKHVFQAPAGARVLAPVQVPEGDVIYVAAATTEGHMLVCEIAELPYLAKGKGNKIIQLSKKEGAEQVAAITLLCATDELKVATAGRSYVLKPQDWLKYIGSRGRRGLKLPRGIRQVVSLTRQVKGS